MHDAAKLSITRIENLDNVLLYGQAARGRIPLWPSSVCH